METLDSATISVTEAARLAGVSGTVIRRWILRGNVLARKPTGQTCGWQVDRVSLAAYAAVPRKRGCPVGRRWKWRRSGTTRLPPPFP